MSDSLIPGVRVSDREQILRLRKCVLQCASVDVDGTTALDDVPVPWADPVPLTKRDLDALRREKYWVAEKSDGERVLVLSLAHTDEGLYLIDRQFEFYRLAAEDLRLPSQRDARLPQHKTLLDAMVVYNHYHRGSALMIMDVYMVEGVRMTEADFSTRIFAIRDRVVAPVRAHASNTRLPIYGKEYYELEKISNVLSCIKDLSDDEGPRFLFQSRTKTRFNENDGVIFYRDADPLVPGERATLKKWKWPALTAVRFFIRPVDEPGRLRRYNAYYGPMASLCFYRELMLDAEEGVKIDRALLENKVTEGVFEFHYDSELGEYRYNRPRFDLEPSSATTIISQLETTATSITVAALVAAFDERVRMLSQPMTPNAPSPSSQLSTVRSASIARESPRSTSVTSAPHASHHSRTLKESPKTDPQRRGEDTEAVLETPSPPGAQSSPIVQSQGLKRARPDETYAGLPEAKRARTE